MREFVSAAATTLVASAALVLAASPAAAAENSGECGFYTYRVNETVIAAYRHCGDTTVRIHVDVPGQGSGNDYDYCSKPWEIRNFGLAGNVLNAYYIGGAGCTP
jgi:hypothetical protein